ncbi:MAG: MBL fold metallo-hydrolase [Eubacteriales bacterium]|nr:MBL fold metallo-hydrolase [Eubacteriales bacterium]
MKVTFLGATHEVTGSCTLIETQGHKFLVDCGMEQGRDVFENQSLPVSHTELDCVIITHAHIDHSGNLPLLSKEGFKGSVYATEATCSLANVMLRDSAHIQQFEAEWRNRKARRSGEEEYVPVYEMKDAEAIIRRLRPCKYGEIIRILENVCIRFADIGHLLGSACIEIWITENGVTKKMVFSGDVGNKNRPIIKNPQKITEADYVVIESTYGNRLHEPHIGNVRLLADMLEKAFKRGGNVVIPSFAVGRTQEILYYIRQIKNERLIPGYENCRVYIDSPLAGEASKIFMQADTGVFNKETSDLIKNGVNPFWFEGLTYTETSEESKAINFNPSPKVIISASGMCEAGRIRHHLKHNLWRPECMVLFVGYQAEGTLGRLLYEGAKHVKLFGEEIEIRAEMQYLPGISGHADKDGLIEWINGFTTKPQTVFVNHGDDEACTEFTETLRRLGYNAYAPFSGTSFDLESGKFVIITESVPVERIYGRDPRAKAIYVDLVAAAEELLELAKASKGGSNKDLAAFTSRIRELIRKQE